MIDKDLKGTLTIDIQEYLKMRETFLEIDKDDFKNYFGAFILKLAKEDIDKVRDILNELKLEVNIDSGMKGYLSYFYLNSKTKGNENYKILNFGEIKL